MAPARNADEYGMDSMNPDPSHSTTSSSQAPTRSRSWISKLTSPLSARTRTLSEFYIRPDEPHRQYSPGDIVKGKVILSVVKPLRITHLVICLHGFVQVFPRGGRTGSSKEGDVGFLGVGRGKRKGEYLGNGFASLFQDEVILCGEGRLVAREYHFNFELEFPSKGLPSSIDFERGTISYMVTSTLTRPTTISPTASCERKISLIERIDVTSLSQPRAQMVSLEAISRRSRPKMGSKRPSMLPSKRKKDQRNAALGQGANDTVNSQCLGALVSQEVPSQSPAPSEIGSESTAGSQASGHAGRLRSHTGVGSLSDDNSTTTADSAKNITATIELLRGGCLRGDMISFTIAISHTKAIKSLHGVVLTLYRQCRLDTHPNIPLGSIEKGNAAGKLKYEDYLPKSKSGLGGLSLSTTGPSSVFRKDLSQTFAPLIIDPRSLTTTIKTSVRVPADAFPTISSVPGALMSFKYFVEVVIDIHGKLAGQDRFLPRVGMVNLPSAYGGGAPPTSGIEEAGSMLAAWGGGVVSTDQIRREKSVVACEFEVIVGTVDNDRRRIKRGVVDQVPLNQPHDDTSAAHDITQPEASSEDHVPSSNNTAREGAPEYVASHYTSSYGTADPTQTTVPLPRLENEDEMDEKTRIRRAEERLLPSGPPVEGDPSSASTSLAPTAPHLDEVFDARGWYQPESTNLTLTTGSARQISYPNEMTVSSPTGESFIIDSDSRVRLADSSPQSPSDDKQELERRRLQAQASAPEYSPNDDDDDAGPESYRLRTITFNAPSAPILTDDDYVGHHDGPSTRVSNVRTTQECLPRYER